MQTPAGLCVPAANSSSSSSLLRAQFTCFHSNSECTLLIWAGCHSLSHTVGVAAKQTTVECVLCGVCAGVTGSNDDKCSAAGLTVPLLYRPSVSDADPAEKYVSRSKILVSENDILTYRLPF